MSATVQASEGGRLGARVWLAGFVGAASFVAGVERVVARWPPLANRRKVVIIVNTECGSAHLASRAVRAIHNQPVEVVKVVRTNAEGLGDAIDAAVTSLPADAVLAVAGGDGTVGRAATAVGRSDRVLAILPTGTGNDVARCLHLPLSPEEAAEVVARGEIGRMDLGFSICGAFVHAATAGITAEFAQRVRHVRGWRRPIIYPAMAWQSWRSRCPLEVKVTVDGQPLDVSGPVQVAVINAPRLGGRIGMNIPGAAVDDGFFDIVIAHRGATRQMVRALTTLMRAGPPQAPVGGLLCQARVVEIDGPPGLAVALDGEPIARAPFRAEAQANACSVLRPKLGGHRVERT